MTTVIAFIVAIGILVAVHEWGHFVVARMCGVRVLRFSVGFGPQVAGWTSVRSGTQYSIGMLPLGGYVRMLDEREGAVAAADRPMAFNVQSISKRAAIVVAGPIANLLLAVILYSVVNWFGVEQPQAVVSRPTEGSIAAKAGFVGGELIRQVAFAGDDPEVVVSFDDFRWWLARAALGRRDVMVVYSTHGQSLQRVVLHLEGLDVTHADAALFRAIGFVSPYSPAKLGELTAQGAAVQAGLQKGDVVLRLENTPIVDANHLRELIRSSPRNGAIAPQTWLVERAGSQLNIRVQPRLEIDGGQPIGRVGAMIGAPPALVTVRYGLAESVQRSLARTAEVSLLTLRMMGQMVTGEASLKNLSGPITIADYAGKSASLGLVQFAVFLALISVSLGVLNLLPLPVLDGGHLMYYLYESVAGRPVPDAWVDRLQKVGLAVLMLMMSIALFNDIHRLLV
ncbi:MAG: RIP metalloprotease RseP [Burkholderiales bacterium]|nr:RIP metalloprotease RseP [Burkholderiales bacterium]